MKIEVKEDQEVIKKDEAPDNEDVIECLSREVSSLSLLKKEKLCDEKDEDPCIERGPGFNTKYRNASRQNNLPYNISPVTNNSYLNDYVVRGDYNIRLPFEELNEDGSNELNGGAQVVIQPAQEILQYLKDPLEEGLEFVYPDLDFIPDIESDSQLRDGICDFVLDHDKMENGNEYDISGRRSVSSDLGSSISDGSVAVFSPNSQFSDTNESVDSCESLVNRFSNDTFSVNSANNGTDNIQLDYNANSNSSPPKNAEKKLIPILPKFDLPTVSTITSSYVLPPACPKKHQSKYSKSLKDEFLNEVAKEEKDKFHKQILALVSKPGGLGAATADGQNYLHTYIYRERQKQAIYFIHILGIWKDKNNKGIQDVDSLINAQDNNGRTPLFYCTIFKMDRVAKILLECGADPNIPETETGDTPLHWASQRGMTYENMVAALSTFPKTDLDRPNNKGMRPLHQAIKNHLFNHEDHNLNTNEIINSKPVIERLLRSGAKLSVKNQDGKTPLHLAVQTFNREILDLLNQFSTDLAEAINIQDNEGSTVLHEAVKAAPPSLEIREKIISMLVGFGAESGIADNNGKTPGYYARQRQSSVNKAVPNSEGKEISGV